MLLLKLCLFGAVCVGVWLILTDFVLFPTRRTEQLYRGARKREGGALDRLIEPLAKKLEPHILMSDYKKEKLTHTLRVIGERQTATQYSASALAQALFLAALGLVTVFLSPLLPVVICAVAAAAYLHIMKQPEKRLREKRARIELELPRFASTISNSLSVSRDVVKLMENYRRVCGAELADELEVTIADMKTGNAQLALASLENRIGSSKLSELVRGLLSVLRGEDQALYFYTKQQEFRREYMEHMQQEIQKRPDRLMPFVFGIVGCFVVMLLYVLIFQIGAGSAGLF